MGVLKVGTGASTGASTGGWGARFALVGSALVHTAGIAGLATAVPGAHPPHAATGPASSVAPPLAFDVLVHETETETASPAQRTPVVDVAPGPARVTVAAPSSRPRARSPDALVHAETAAAKATPIPEAAAVPSDPMPLEVPNFALHAGPTVPAPEPKAVAFAPSAIPASSTPPFGDEGASMGLYAQAMQIRLGRAAASRDVVALVERRANMVLQIVVDLDGAVRDARVVEGDTDPALRSAALRIERSAEPFPPLPPEIRAGGPVAFRVPLRFVLRRR